MFEERTEDTVLQVVSKQKKVHRAGTAHFLQNFRRSPKQKVHRLDAEVKGSFFCLLFFFTS